MAESDRNPIGFLRVVGEGHDELGGGGDGDVGEGHVAVAFINALKAHSRFTNTVLCAVDTE